MKSDIPVLRKMLKITRKAIREIGQRPRDKWQGRAPSKEGEICSLQKRHNGGCALGLNISDKLTEEEREWLDWSSISGGGFVGAAFNEADQIGSVHGDSQREQDLSRKVLTDIGLAFPGWRPGRKADMVSVFLSSLVLAHDDSDTQEECIEALRELERGLIKDISKEAAK